MIQEIINCFCLRFALEAAGGIAAIILCAVACWREDRLVAWEDKHFRRERSEYSDEN